MSQTAFFPGSAPSSSYYSTENPFSYGFNGGEEYSFDPTFSPDMSRYLKSPTPASGQETEGHTHTHSASNQVQSPSSFDMSNLTLRSPTGPQPQSQPIPITTTSGQYSHPAYSGLDQASSLPYRHGDGLLYHPYSRPDQAHFPLRSPPGSSRSVNSGALSSALVSPMSDNADMSPLHLGYNAYHYIASPLNSYGVLGGGTGTDAANGNGTGHGVDDTPRDMIGLGLIGGVRYPRTGVGMGQGTGQIPQYPPGVRGRGRAVRGGRGGGGGLGRGGRKSSGGGGVKQEDEDEDDDAEGESVAGEMLNGTHKSHLEKHRRRVLKSHFKALSDELQTAGGMTKITKAGTLDRATSYIQELKAAMNSTTHTLEYLQQELMKERQAHVETQRLNAELSRALAARSASGSGSPRA